MVWLIAYGVGALATFVYSAIMSSFEANKAMFSTGILHLTRWKKVAFKSVIWPAFWAHLVYVFFEEIIFGE